ncbi:Aspartate aminotransferase (EC [Olavius algarvensis associated proteobacterium Delta 3]|nr:Aspartate aminotransferase (EC [Olavius algarvensis associated proteobacterium Delta 3]CAB5098437.1 Aspartate aminotransferase (EC [Olavius algarvensis associated proteobacterium Delta 3]
MLTQHFGNDGALPFWVADMDFRSPDVVIDSLIKRSEHGIFGYEYKKENYFDALVNWYENRHRWLIDLNHIEFCPSVLNGISILINQHSDKGDGIIIQPPVFFEFRLVIRSNNRNIIKNPLNVVDGKYQMNFDDLEEKAANPKTKIMIICNPHNPVGRVWTRGELSRAGEICRQHNVLLISDEIHGDIVYKPHQYTPFSSISDELARISATCLSPAKTFNISGVIDAMTVIANEEYRDRFHEFAHRYHINKTNVFASAAIEAAYSQGGKWLDELLSYLRANIDFLKSYLHDNLPQVRLIEPEGTYLAWLNFEELGLDAKELEKFLAQKAQLALNSGYWFGREGAGYSRMNIACPKSILHEALLRLTNAARKHL